MTDPAPRPDLPTRAEREARNAALLATGTETGFWDDNGRPAPWPDDIDDWTPYAPGLGLGSAFNASSTRPRASPIT